jgi:hypothetical protein
VKRALSVAAIIACLGSAAAAEVVELRDGRRFEGKLQQATQMGVLIEVGGQALTFSADQVRAIYYDQAPVLSGKADPSPGQTGLAALQAFRKKLGEGVTSREYSALLADVTLKMEAVRRDDRVPAPVKDVLEKALGYYNSASSVWEGSLRNRSSVIDEATIARLLNDRCPELRAVRDRERGVVLQKMWLCAGDALDDAERLVR